MKLTDVRIRNAKPKGKTYKLSDGAGMYLLVTKDGARFWRFDYRFNGKRQCRFRSHVSVERPLEDWLPKVKIRTLPRERQSERSSSQVIILSRQLHGNG